jgi:hypothetical protein
VPNNPRHFTSRSPGPGPRSHYHNQESGTLFAMPFSSAIQSLRMRNLTSASPANFVSMATLPDYGDNAIVNVFRNKLPPHSSHPNFANLTLLVFEAVMEVVCVSLPGYIVARMGQFDAENQKFIANLNTQLFTPCLSKSRHASLILRLTKAYSLHQIGVTTFCGEAAGSGRYTVHFYRAIDHILCCSDRHISCLQVQQAREELRHRHGCMLCTVSCPLCCN